MSAILLRVRVWVRRRLRQLLVTALVIGVTGGLAVGLASGTRRTDSAPDRYTTFAGGDPDLVITQLQGPPLTARVGRLPGVVGAKSLAFVTSFLVSPTDGSPVIEPNPFAGDGRLVGARVAEGRFADPQVPDEFTVNRTFAKLLVERFGTHVGDQFQVTSFNQDQVEANAFDSGVPPQVPLFAATLVGITETPSDFDDPSPQMVFSEAFLAAHPTVGVVQTIIAADLEAGTDPQTVMDAVHGLPNGSDAFAVPERVVSSDARRAVRFQVTALWLVTAIASLAAAVVISQLIVRMLRVDDDERSALLAIGWRPRHIAGERAIEGAVAALIAVPIAVVIGFVFTALFPLGVLRSFEPHSGPRMDWVVTLAGVVALCTVVVIAAAFAGRRRLPEAETEGRAGKVAGLIAAGGASMSLATGARLIAFGPRGGRRSMGSLAAGVIGLAGVVGAGVVGLSLTTIVDQPDRWGINYDQLFGNPYVAANNDIVAAIVDDPDIAALTAGNIGSLTINGHDTATFAVDAVRGGLFPTTLEGRPPSNGDEIGLGAEVARRLGVHVGDEVEAVGASSAPRQVRVVGIVITPDSAGNGATMTFDAYAELNPTATKNVLLVKFRKGAPSDAADKVAAANFSPPGTLIKATSVRALERVTAAPFLLGAVLGVLLIVTCAYLLATSVRARQRDLAVLRALGSDGRQLRAIVHWQATLVAVLVVAIGLPSGIIVGRWVVRLLTTALGIVPGADVPLLLVFALPVTVLAMANLLALVPARRAARAEVLTLMRDR